MGGELAYVAKILMMSDSPFLNTGFSTQSLFLLNKLSELGHECHFLAHNFIGQSMKPHDDVLEDGTPFRFWLHGNGREAYGKDILSRKIKQLRPDFFIVLLDTFMVYPWFSTIDLSPAKVVFWFPSDGGGGLPEGCLPVLQRCDSRVSMALFGQRQLKSVHGLDCVHIPHAVNEKIFYRLSDEERLALRLKWRLDGKFVVGVVARNQGRKALDRTIKSFKRLADKYADAVLLMHCDPYDSAAAFNLPLLINRYGLNNRVVFTGTNYFKGFTYAQMNEVYNLMDCMFLSTTGEGFGVPVVEALSCEVPVVMTDYTTGRELLVENGRCGLLVRLVGVGEDLGDGYSKDFDFLVDNGTVTGNWNVERGFCDVGHAFEQLCFLHDNPDAVRALGRAGREKVLKFYTWDVVGSKWNDLLRGML